MKVAIVFLLVLWVLPATAAEFNFMDREIDAKALSKELLSAGFTCRISQTNRVIEGGVVVLETHAGEKLTRAVNAAGRKMLLDAEGNEVHPSDARQRKTARYIRLNCDEAINLTVVQGILNAHVSQSKPVEPTAEERRRQEIRDEAMELLRDLGLVE